MVEMTVVGITLDPETRGPLLILRVRDAEIVMPVWIGAMEALSISFALAKTSLPRPLTHDLLIHVLEKLEATLVCVRLTETRQETFIAELELASAQGTVLLDARPSDAIALALRANAPIFAARDMVRKLGHPVTPDQLARYQRLAPGELALLFSSPQEKESGAQTATPDDLFTEIRHDARMRKLQQMQKLTQENAQPRTCQPAVTIDLADQDALKRLLQSLSPETKYKM